MSDDDDAPNPANLSWGQRNGLTIMLVVMGLCFVLVLAAQHL